VVALGEEYGLEVWLAFGLIQRGWTRAEQGEAAEGIDEIRRGLAAYEATGAKLWRAQFLGLLARALARDERPDEGLAIVTEALALAFETGERDCLPELHRLEGELRLVDGDAASAARAEACFMESLAVARQQQARSLELRATTSLARLRQQQGRADEAARIVGEALAWFTEGFETADLRAAAALIHERATDSKNLRQCSATSRP
jgi:predicted ATPase